MSYLKVQLMHNALILIGSFFLSWLWEPIFFRPDFVQSNFWDIFWNHSAFQFSCVYATMIKYIHVLQILSIVENREMREEGVGAGQFLKCLFLCFCVIICWTIGIAQFCPLENVSIECLALQTKNVFWFK